jgi:simple sugar transport system ATP-binding protein
MSSQDTAVRLEGITKRFPGVLANDEVDLRVERGSVHALLGENGAGKTTLMNVLYGLYEPTDGRIVVDGVEQSFDSPRDAIDAGVGMIHQHFMLVGPMTVAENIVLGYEPRKWGGLAIDRAAADRAVRELGERYGFDVDPDATVADVSVGVRQRVEILKSLYRGADLLILDEPTAVLTPQEVADLYEVMSELTAAGKTIVFITHKLGEAMHAADEITVLRDGRNVGTVDADATSREELARLMVGRDVVMELDPSPTEPGAEILRVEEVTVETERGVDAVDGVSFAVREGEIFGIAGVDGNGQAELVEAVTGIRRPDAGRIRFAGSDATGGSRRDRTDVGMAYVPEDRQERGLVMPFDLVENAILGSQHRTPFAGGGRLDWAAARDHAEAVVETHDVRPPDADVTAESLSGGNQQKFVVGRELERDPRLMVAAQPTRGVDVGATEFIRSRLLDLRNDGQGVLLVSSKLDEVQALADRLAVMYEGELMAVVDPASVTEEELGLLMAGEYPDGMEPGAAARAAAVVSGHGDGAGDGEEAAGVYGTETDAGDADTAVRGGEG